MGLREQLMDDLKEAMREQDESRKRAIRSVLAAIKKGIAKVNVGTEIRQTYEQTLKTSKDVATAQSAVYDRTCWLIKDYFGLSGTRSLLLA